MVLQFVGEYVIAFLFKPPYPIDKGVFVCENVLSWNAGINGIDNKIDLLKLYAVSAASCFFDYKILNIILVSTTFLKRRSVS